MTSKLHIETVNEDRKQLKGITSVRTNFSKGLGEGRPKILKKNSHFQGINHVECPCYISFSTLTGLEFELKI